MNWYIFLLVSSTVLFFIIFTFGEKLRTLFLHILSSLSGTKNYLLRSSILASITTGSDEEDEEVELPSPRGIDHRAFIQFIMQCLLSIVILGFAFYAILSKTVDDATKKWACTVIGSIIGFWLKSVP